MPDVALHIDSSIYRFWKDASITRSMDELAGSFGLSVTDKWSAGSGRWGGQPIKRGAACKVSIGGRVVISGYVDDVVPEYDHDNHSIRVTGRDATGDLVDCSPINRPSEWAGLTLDGVAREICKPFNIPVRVETDMGRAFPRFALELGETAHAAIDRACKQRGVLAMADGAGGLILCRAGAARHGVVLEEGVNIKKARGTFSMRQRHSEYLVLGQQPGFDGGTTADFAQSKGRATDAGVRRHRPLVVLAEQAGDGANFQDRATWEANVRLGRGDAIEVDVFGWYDQGTHGELWMPNRLVQVRSPKLDYAGDLLIKTVTNTQNDRDGTISTLSLVRKEAFALIPQPVIKGAMWG